MKKCEKFNNIEELNKACEKGLVIYSIAQCGAGWFVEYETDRPEQSKSNDNATFTSYDFMNKALELGLMHFDHGYNKYRIDDTGRFKALARTLSEKELKNLKALSRDFVATSSTIVYYIDKY